MSIYLGDIPLANNSVSRNIGEIIQSTIPLSDAGLHLLDGALISGAGSYSAFVTYIAGLVSNYPDLFITETAWQQSITDYGVCGKFVYDSTNNTVRLPKITGFTEGTTDLTALGDLVEAGLPNIEGTYKWGDRQTANTASSGALYDGGTFKNYKNGGGSSATIPYLAFDASRSNPIYGNSDTVQPQSVKVLYYIVIANSVKTDIEVNIDEVMTDLNGKADVDLSNVNTSGTSLASGWAMPSDRYIDLTLGASGSTYTAPANGYIYFSKDRSGSSNQYAVISGASDGIPGSLGDGAQADGYGVHILRPIKKGTTFRVTYTLTGTTKYFRFVYAEGEPNV